MMDERVYTQKGSLWEKMATFLDFLEVEFIQGTQKLIIF